MSSSRGFFCHSVSILFVCLFPALVCAQKPSFPPPSNTSKDQLTFKRNVNRVILDVVVTDANGKPVHGLKERDFTVSEDAVKQKILSLDVRDLETPATLVSNLPTLPPNTFTNVPAAPEQGPLYVLLLDLHDTIADDQPYAREQLLKFINSKPPGTRYAIFVLSDGLHLVEGFTADRGRLYAAVDPSQPRPHVPRILINNYADVNALGALESIADYLDGLPGRKNMIWFSGLFPLPLFAADGVDPGYQAKVVETLRSLARTQTAIYPVDVRGVVAGDNPATTHKMVMLLSGDYQIEDGIARITGGHAFYSRNDLNDALSDATELGGNYYTISYSSSNHNYDGKLRNVEVSLSRNGCHLEYRRSYYAYTQEQPTQPERKASETFSQESPADLLYANMRHGVPTIRDVVFRVHVYPSGAPVFATPEQLANLTQQFSYFDKRQKSEGKKLLSVKLQTYSLDYTIVGRVPILDIATAAYDADGELLNTDIEHTMSPGTSQESTPEAGKYYRIQQSFQAPVTAAYMRLGVRDVTADRIGTLEIPLPLSPDGDERALQPAK